MPKSNRPTHYVLPIIHDNSDLSSVFQYLFHLAGHQGFEPRPAGFGVQNAAVTPMTLNSLAVAYKAQRRTALDAAEAVLQGSDTLDLAGRLGYDPRTRDSKSLVFPTTLSPNNLVRTVRLELTKPSF